MSQRLYIPVETSFKDKFDNLLLFLFSKTEYDGELLDVGFHFFNHYVAGYFSSRNIKELSFLFDALKESEYILIHGMGNYSTNIEVVQYPTHVKITTKGIVYSNEISNSGINSNNCFVAMAFGKETDRLYKVIESTIIDNNFIPIRVDKKHISSEQTINDYIISSIKASHFCIADFTFNRNGVYFEAGYALGRGLKVIYTCKNDHIEHLHFDLKPLQFIIYENTKELKEALDYKIKSFILE